MFSDPKAIISKRVVLTKNTAVSVEECDFKEYITSTLKKMTREATEGSVECESLTFSLGIPEDIGRLIAEQKKMKGSEEEYVLITGKSSFVYAREPIGFLRALSTLMQMSVGGGIREGALYDYPGCTERGYRVFLPGYETFEDFKKMLDLLVYFKIKSLVIEIGGAMEYKKHSRINEKWVEYCKDANSYSGRVDEIQYNQGWEKNIIHCENGDGGYITQEMCREIAQCCRERGIEIIPEVPTLSHADYICLAYPEIAERENDPFPDTYCPSNPGTYEIVFDILDEIIDVFKPKRINIGHDELYTACVCERCKDKKPSDIYAEDVRKISEYLAGRGVGTMMWGEKLLRARWDARDGAKVGGWFDEKDHHGINYKIPDLYECADKMPKGVTYLNWYYVFGDHLDDEYHSRNYPVIFGNFEISNCKGFRSRINRGVLGGYVSNWGTNQLELMQKNHALFNLAAASYALWSESYDNNRLDELNERTFKELFNLRNSTVKSPIRVRHNTNFISSYVRQQNGVFAVDNNLLGNYEVTYSDGTKAHLPVKYGTNIGYRFSNTMAGLKEISYATLPMRYPDGYVYEHWYENPYPEKTVSDITYVPCAGKEHLVMEHYFIW